MLAARSRGLESFSCALDQFVTLPFRVCAHDGKLVPAVGGFDVEMNARNLEFDTASAQRGQFVHGVLKRSEGTVHGPYDEHVAWPQPCFHFLEYRSLAGDGGQGFDVELVS